MQSQIDLSCAIPDGCDVFQLSCCRTGHQATFQYKRHIAIYPRVQSDTEESAQRIASAELRAAEWSLLLSALGISLCEPAANIGENTQSAIQIQPGERPVFGDKSQICLIDFISPVVILQISDRIGNLIDEEVGK